MVDAAPDRVTRYYQGHVFGPVQPLDRTVPVETLYGQVPINFPDGFYLRNGPNPINVRGNVWYHIFDGDGMIHCVRFKRGHATTYSNHQLETKRKKETERLGYDPFMSIGDTMSKFFLPRLAKKILWEQIGVTSDISPYERGVANTSVEFHAGKLMALHEASFPFEFTTSDEGIMKSLGFFDYDGKLVHPMTAHPKIDPETGELILFAYKLEKKPHLIISKVSADGKLHSTIPVFNLDRASMIHDFAITENYIVFCDTSLVFTPKNAGINIFNFGRTKAVFEFDTSRPARVGVLKKDSTNEADIKWFDVNPAFFFHSINAWEEKDPKSGEVLLKYMICKADNNSIDLNDVEKIRTGVYLWEINLNSGKVSEDYMLFKWPDSEELKPLYADFPQISPHKIGRKMDFAYLARVSAEPTASYNGEFYKLDLRKNPPEISRYQLSKGQFATEASFVHQSSESDEKLEGSGFLVSIVSSVNGDGEVHIINADSMELEYRGKLPNRIPFGFHGRYLLEEEYLTANQQ